MKTILFTLLTVTTFFLHAQTTYTYTGTGNWTDTGNWSPSYPGSVIDQNDELIISTGSEVTVTTITIIRGTLTNNGILDINSLFTNHGSTINENSITSGILGQFINEGTVTNNGQYTNGGTFINNSSLNNNGIFQNNFILSGNNTSHTNNFNLSSILSPNDGSNSTSGIGTYTFGGNVTFLSSANLNSDIRNTSEVDLINITGSATLSGTLSISLLDDYDPPIGTNYTILTAASIQGTFTSISYSPLANNKIFQINYTNTNVTLTVIDKTAAPFIYSGTGNWTDQNNWTPAYPGTIIDQNIEIVNRGTLTINSSVTNNGSITNEETITNTSLFTNEGTICLLYTSPSPRDA